MRVTMGTNTLNLQQIGGFEVLSPIPGSAEKAIMAISRLYTLSRAGGRTHCGTCAMPFQ
jgi:hypothetical protein